jgi:hypothetical protein
MNAKGFEERAEEDVNLLPGKRDELIKAIEAAGFIVADIKLHTRDRAVGEKLVIGFEVCGLVYIDMG